VAVFAVPVLIGLGRAIALGYDEAVYAGATRSVATLGATEVWGWGIHRPPGLPLVGVPFLVAGGGDEWALRLVGVASGAVIIAAAWWGGRLMAGEAAGVIAAFATAVASPIQVEATAYLTDLPSTAVLLVVAVLCLAVLWAPRRRWQDFALLAALAVLAFYLRYGAALGALSLALAAIATRRQAILSREAGVGALVGAVLLVPHLIAAVMATGSPLGILDAARRAAAGDSLAIGAYPGWLPADLVGPLGAALALLAVALAVVAATASSVAEPFRGRVLFLTGAAVIGLVLVAVSVHAEPRYVLFPMLLLIIVGSAGVSRAVSGRADRRWVVAVVGVVLVAAAVLGGLRTVAVIADRESRWDWLRSAGDEIGADAGDGACSVLTSDVPIIAWYSGCAAVNYLSGPQADRLDLLGGMHRYIVVRTDGHLQPDDAAMRALLEDAELWRSYRDGFGDEAARVYRAAP
jgi:4-amino-4-deoxy-L-arabinose transferase-like glycosyltransferase